ncbi:IS5 family transposase [Mesorhizobium sp. M1396]|uniref:IS5 family transposase n=1 Tax=Mesorhizobium sp. M1396 TaxID=2957095 RepID=UPI0033380B3E
MLSVPRRYLSERYLVRERGKETYQPICPAELDCHKACVRYPRNGLHRWIGGHGYPPVFRREREQSCPSRRTLHRIYFQYLCGEEFFCHALPFDRSSMTRWRSRMGEERIVALLQESLSLAVKTGAMKPSDTRQVIVDTTVQPKNVMFPTDAKLIHRARERLVRLARKTGLNLRQSYVRVGKLALIKHQRYAHAKQFKRANKALRRLKTYLGRTIRDISRQVAGDAELDALFKWPLYQAATVLEQRQRQRGRKIYSLHAHEVECIGKGKAHMPYEFGVKVSVATTLKRSKGGQFALHAKALPGNPYDGHTLASVIPDMEETIGNEIGRILADAGYRGHNAPQSHRFRVFTSGQKRRVTSAIKRQMRRRSAVEPVIGHIKAEHRMGRNYLAGQQGDAVNAILAAAGYNFSLLLRWLKGFLSLLIALLQLRPNSVAA